MAAQASKERVMKRLLVATDLTPASSNALARAIRLAVENGGAIRIVHAIAPWTPLDDTIAIRKHILVEARLMAEEMTGSEPDISVTLSRRRPETAILRDADRFGADLILLGAHAKPRFRDALFGTIGSHVVRRSDRPVLIVQASDAPAYRKVMIGLDDPTAAERVFTAALGVAPGANDIFAVHACDPPASPLFGEGRSQAKRRKSNRAIEAFLHAYMAGLPGPVTTAHAAVDIGDVSAVLIGQAFARAPDLLAIGRHRRSPFLGSHAIDTLGWCRSDLLIVPDVESEPVAMLAATAT